MTVLATQWQRPQTRGTGTLDLGSPRFRELSEQYRTEVARAEVLRESSRVALLFGHADLAERDEAELREIEANLDRFRAELATLRRQPGVCMEDLTNTT